MKFDFLALLDLKDEHFCKDPYYPILTQSNCRKAAEQYSLNSENIILDESSYSNKTNRLNFGHCYQRDNKTHFGKRSTGTDFNDNLAFCIPGNIAEID